MGISNLLPFVKKACRQGNLVELKGCTVAVDVSCLLHKGLFGCMEQFAQGEDTKFYIYYVKKYVQALLDIGCHVIMVFDGRPLPAKKDTNDERRQRRQENMRAGEVLLSQGRKDEAIGKFQQAVSITAEVVENTIQFFRSMSHVDVIVSPYEADAQLAFLTKEGLADAVITEDSDLIAFGCEKIIFKLVAQSGDCTIYERKNLPLCFTGEMNSKFDFVKFRRICILSGCDYLQAGLPGVGLSKALTFFMKTTQSDLRVILPRVPSYLKMTKLKVSKEFIEEFIRAENTFLHQVVFDPRQRCQRPLHPYPLPGKGAVNKENAESPHDDDDDCDFVSKKPLPAKDERDSFRYAGSVSSAAAAVRLALGNPGEQQSLMDKFLLPSKIPEWSVWADTFESKGKKSQREQAEAKKKAKQCGAFVLDSPSKKVKKKAKLGSVETAKDEIDEIFICGDTPEKPSKAVNKVTKVPAKRKLKNEADQSWSIAEMMKMYGGGGESDGTSLVDSESDDLKNNSSPVPVGTTASSVSTSVLHEHNEVASTQSAVIETSSRSSLTVTKVSSSQSSAPSSAPSVPSIVKASSLTVTSSTSISTPSGKVVGRSAYFVNRTSGCSNPFKRPRIDPSLSSPSMSTAAKTEDDPSSTKKSHLLSLDDDPSDSPSSVSSFRFSPLARPVGYRAPGLRKSITK